MQASALATASLAELDAPAAASFRTYASLTVTHDRLLTQTQLHTAYWALLPGDASDFSLELIKYH